MAVEPKRTCLKFTGYIYLTKDEDISTMSAKELFKRIDYHKERRNGRVKIYDDYNKKTITEKDIQFDNWGQLIQVLEDEYRRRSNGRLKKYVLRLFSLFKSN